MTSRPQIPNRPWLRGAQYDKYSTRDMLHVDMYAYQDAYGFTYFDVQMTAQGREPVARSVHRYVHEFDVLTELQALPPGLLELRWRRATHDRFKRVHGRLLDTVSRVQIGRPRTVLAHYVKASDADPWPRNTVNTYKAPQYAEGKRPGRPRKPRISPEDTQRINILMGVDTLGVL